MKGVDAYDFLIGFRREKEENPINKKGETMKLRKFRLLLNVMRFASNSTRQQRKKLNLMKLTALQQARQYLAEKSQYRKYQGELWLRYQRKTHGTVHDVETRRGYDTEANRKGA